MNYQALYRKWRPQSLNQVVGQAHIVSAITNSLEMNKIHHAWLFHGIRGTGKTSIARILAKNLNCEKKITNIPCQNCKNCLEISYGKFLDLIEIDAASHTKVENIKELFKYIQYPPIIGRFKIYLIDEIHMLSNHSFHALLKQLEEPPKYIKFILATTNLEKLPKTILSRCLIFNLKPIHETDIFNKIIEILKIEKIFFEKQAIKIISKYSEGSLRDALCLVEQAISIGNGTINNCDINSILGIPNDDHSIKIIIFILKKDIKSIMKIIDKINQLGIEWEQILISTLKILHHIALSKHFSEIWNDHEFNDNQIKILKQISNKVSSLKIQNIYKILMLGRKEIKFSPTIRMGFEMTLLKLTSE